ncbi:O-antigen ligase like membrane protein [Micromonospora viridifaciens]|uniref:O-antigen ligase like membrane protein n=1 Tax=Micromonospora viridifaciens TaxID=1881 RepID=A0A1C4YXX2_MICVI|nr:O-antigen ligase family protein [Micromonospora viridifaciens]SCF25609.1 O-antigen ligase like membrane protein [Micromonospora viridifaciens]
MADDYLALRPAGSRQAAFVLQIFIVTAFLFPTDTVIRVVGAQGYVASLVSITIFLAWLVTALFGYHDPIHTRYPARGALALLWISSLLSYAVMPFYGPTETQRLSADRWIMLLVGMSGVILMAAEHLRAWSDILRVVRTLIWGAAFSGCLAVLQFWARWDLRPYLRMPLIGFEQDMSYSGMQARDALMRVSGTANHPIEMGVIAGMLLPLAIWLGLHDRERSPVRRWFPVAVISMCIPMSVSRSAILAVAVSLATFTVLLPPLQRSWMMAFLPVGLVGIFATTPGYVGTILNSFTAGKSDSSITNRLNNYPRVMAALEEAPWLGRGGGTDIASDATKILDNQYLKTAVEMGGIGVLALCLFFLVPAIAVLAARLRFPAQSGRALCAAVAGSCLAAGVGSFTFDAFSFAQFASVDALVVGLSGACWLHALRLQTVASSDSWMRSK